MGKWEQFYSVSNTVFLFFIHQFTSYLECRRSYILRTKVASSVHDFSWPTSWWCSMYRPRSLGYDPKNWIKISPTTHHQDCTRRTARIEELKDNCWSVAHRCKSGDCTKRLAIWCNRYGWDWDMLPLFHSPLFVRCIYPAEMKSLSLQKLRSSLKSKKYGSLRSGKKHTPYMHRHHIMRPLKSILQFVSVMRAYVPIREISTISCALATSTMSPIALAYQPCRRLSLGVGHGRSDRQNTLVGCRIHIWCLPHICIFWCHPHTRSALLRNDKAAPITSIDP